MQRNWLRTNDIHPDQDFADVMVDYGLYPADSPMHHLKCKGLDMQETVWHCHTCRIYDQMS